MKIYRLLIIYIILAGTIYAQLPNSVSGYVRNAENNEPLSDVNVYISSTIYGTITDSRGFFELKSLPKGTHQLVISVIGYKGQSKTILLKRDTKLVLNFKLVAEIYEADVISIEARSPDEWLKNLEKFKILFRGKSSYASECIIQNEEVLDFKNDRKSNMLTASASAPLKIKNNALGFEIECVLENFYWNRNEGKWGWTIRPRFTVMTPANNEEREKWRENRMKAYLGSKHHFLWSIKRGVSIEEGYEIYISKIAGRVRGNDQFKLMAAITDSLLKPGYVFGQHLLSFDDYLYVIYKGGYQDVERQTLETFQFNRAHQESWIRLKYQEVTIDEFGYVEEYLPFEVAGYWADRGIADLIPRYFDVR